MDSSAPSKLTAFQREVLDAFFQRERGFFLTGGAALAGFHLGHRTTEAVHAATRCAMSEDPRGLVSSSCDRRVFRLCAWPDCEEGGWLGRAARVTSAMEDECGTLPPSAATSTGRSK